MKSTTASLIITALASTVIAQPHGHGHQHPARAAHQHGQPVQKRALVTEWDTEWVTEYVTEYVDASTTELFYPTSSSSFSSPATTLATVVTSATPGEFYEPSSSTPSSSTVVIAPVETSSSSSSAYVAPPAPTTSSISSEAYVAPETTSSTTSEAYVAPETTSSTTPVETPTTTQAVETPATTSTAAASSSSSGSTVSVNADVEAILGSDYFTGDLTYYGLGLGACGIDNSGEDMTANIVAMSATTMGAQSNGNPMCGKTIKIYNSLSGKTATGTIQDKCPGCVSDSIDVSQKLFEELADLADGRVEISWAWA